MRDKMMMLISQMMVSLEATESPVSLYNAVMVCGVQCATKTSTWDAQYAGVAKPTWDPATCRHHIGVSMLGIFGAIPREGALTSKVV